MNQLSRFFVIGANHRCASVALREKIAFSREGGRLALDFFRETDFLAEAAILSTCNRVEIYGMSDRMDAIEAEMIAFMSRFHGLREKDFRGRTYFYSGQEAVRHLFRVAGGLDSMIVGENEIVGQVRESFQRAFFSKRGSSFLRAVFEWALKNAKQLRREITSSGGAVSVASVAVDWLKEKYGDLRGSRILVLGTGEMSALILKELSRQETGKLWVSGRRAECCEALARGSRAVPVAFGKWKACLSKIDILITATSAPHPILRKADLRGRMRKRGGRPLFVVDMAVPRDTEPGIGLLPGVSVCDMDELQKFSEAGPAAGKADFAKCEDRIEKRAEEFIRWYRGLGAGPMIKRLRESCDQMIAREVGRKKTGKRSSASPDLKRSLERMKGKFLHELLLELKKKYAEGREIDEAFFEESLRSTLKGLDYGEKKDAHRDALEPACAVSGGACPG